MSHDEETVELSTSSLNTEKVETAAPVLDDPAAFLAKTEMPVDYVFLPRRRVRMRIRGIRSRERAELEKRLEVRKGKDKETNLALFREWLCIYGCIRENGQQMFGSEHLQGLRNMPAGEINTIAEAIMKLSGIGADDVEELVGNSESDHSPSSSGT